jgi:hypothetical protein
LEREANGLEREANGLERGGNGLEREASGLEREANGLERIENYMTFRISAHSILERGVSWSPPPPTAPLRGYASIPKRRLETSGFYTLRYLYARCLG